MSERVRLSYEVTMVRLEVCREKTIVRLTGISKGIFHPWCGLELTKV